MVSYKTKEYDLLVQYNRISVSQEDAEKILKWFSTPQKMRYVSALFNEK